MNRSAMKSHLLLTGLFLCLLVSGCIFRSNPINITVYPGQQAGSIELSPQKQVYRPGDTVQLYARANADWKFVAWTGAMLRTDNPLQIQLDSAIELTAYFVSTAPDPPDASPPEGEAVEGEFLEGELPLEGESPPEGELPLEGEPLSCTEFYPWEWEIAGQPVPAVEQIISWEQDVYEQINAFRQEHGLSALFLDTCVSRVARTHSRDMAANTYLDHVNLSGEDFGERLRAGDVQWKTCGENIAYFPSSDLDPITPTVEAWMESSRHRTNILLEKYTHTGIGIALTADGGVYITQNFVRY